MEGEAGGVDKEVVRQGGAGPFLLERQSLCSASGSGCWACSEEALLVSARKAGRGFAAPQRELSLPKGPSASLFAASLGRWCGEAPELAVSEAACSSHQLPLHRFEGLAESSEGKQFCLSQRCLALMVQSGHRRGTGGFCPAPTSGRVFGLGVKSECPIFFSPRKSVGSLGDSALSLNYAAM